MKTVGDVLDLLGNMVLKMKQERDELKVQLHLAGKEVQDEFNRLTGKLDQLNDQYQPVKDAVGKTAENVGSALLLAAEEMMNGFHRVRKAVSQTKE